MVATYRPAGRIWALCCLGLLLSLLAQPVRAEPCAALPPAAVSVKVVPANTVQHFDYSVSSLTRLGGDLARPQQQVLGLTRGQAVVRFQLQIPRVLDPLGQWECASPQISLHYGFDPITVYVAREFPPGSCAHQEILAHEMRHLETYQAHAGRLETEISAALQRRFVGPRPWRGPAGQTQAILRRELDERWLPYVKMLLERVEAEQALIDTPEEYTRITGSCDGEISQRLIRF